ncbi:MAG: MFS transporter [Actinobacteria bacterium]|nr:MFS transporter [Actinomycetota bacterium]
MHGSGFLVAALRRRDFRRLLRVRLAGQFGDGAFQASLAGAVLFNPQHEARATDVAAALAVVLLPYSMLGPFAGIVIDRWSRQRVLTVANGLRTICVLAVGAEIAAGVTGAGFYITSLVVVSANRFVLAALSASLPHVVELNGLVTSNAVTTTAGAIATALGGGGGIVVKAPIHGDSGYAIVALLAAVAYLIAAVTSTRFGRLDLGPDDDEQTDGPTARHVLSGLLAGARHAWRRTTARDALIMISLTRVLVGVTTVSTLLLYRYYFHAEGIFRAGLSGIGQAVGALAVGSGLAAFVTPGASRRIGFVRWSVALLVIAAGAELGLGLQFEVRLQLLFVGLLGFTAQGVKICVDTIVQQAIDDDFRGRVFSVYDTLFNVGFVGAAAITALSLPEDGHSAPAVIGLGVAYLVIAAGYAGRTVGSDDAGVSSVAHTTE